MSTGDARSVRKVPRPGASSASTPALKIPIARTPSLEPPKSALDPSVLVIGADEGFVPALRLSLTRHSVHVESCPLAQALEMVVVAAPDLILLAGDAARDTGQGLLAKLTSSPVSSVIPVVLFGDDTKLDARLRAFRHGAAAVIPRSASVDAVAEQVARLAREIPERGGQALGEVGEATLEEFVATLAKELRTGILTVKPADSEAPIRLVLGGGRPLAAVIDDFVKRVRRHVVRAEPLLYEFDDRAGGTIEVSPGEEPDPDNRSGDVTGLRVLLSDDDPARVDVVAQELRARGAKVAVCGLTPDDGELVRLRQLDPEAVILGERDLQGKGYALLRRMKRDTRLRWASLLVVRWDELRDPNLGVPVVDRFTASLATLAEADRGLCDRAELGDSFDARLEVNGPARCLRALAQSGRSLRVSIHNPRLTAEIDFSDGLLVGASAQATSGERWEGAQALSAVLVLGSGRVHVEPAAQPATTNIMSPVETALNVADREPAPIVPSMPPPPPAGPLAISAASAAAAGGPSLAMPAAPAPESLPARWKSRFGRSGVSAPLFVVLVILAAVQGLLIAGGIKLFGGRAPAPSPSTEASSPSAASRPEAKPQPAPVAEASTSPPAAETPSPETPSPPTERAIGASDGSNKSAPSCEALLLSGGTPNGERVGAAFEQVKTGRRALVQGRLDESEKAYCTAASWDSKNAGYRLELAQLFLIRRDGAQASEWAKRALELEPQNTKAQALLGDALVRIGDDEGARRAWFTAANLTDPTPVQIEQLSLRHLKEADDAVAARDYLRAERFYRRSAGLSSVSVAARRGLSTALLRMGETQAALRWARQAAEIAPRDAAAQIWLGEALLATGDKAGARTAWLEAERLGYPDAKRRIELLDGKP